MKKLDVFCDKQEAYEERAAIIEYDGGLTRKEAERLAAELTGYKPNRFGEIKEKLK